MERPASSVAPVALSGQDGRMQLRQTTVAATGALNIAAEVNRPEARVAYVSELPQSWCVSVDVELGVREQKRAVQTGGGPESQPPAAKWLALHSFDCVAQCSFESARQYCTASFDENCQRPIKAPVKPLKSRPLTRFFSTHWLAQCLPAWIGLWFRRSDSGQLAGIASERWEDQPSDFTALSVNVA